MNGDGGRRTPAMGLGLGRSRGRRGLMSYLYAGPRARGMGARSYSTRILHTRAPRANKARTLLSYACQEVIHPCTDAGEVN